MNDADLLGKKLGPYVIRQRLGKGGMGVVYLAHDTALERLVALKVLAPAFADHDELVKRFQREARAAARLNHPNIVQVYGVDIESRPPFMVMEYVRGASIDLLLQKQGPLPWQQALNICAQVAAALHSAHEQGIIHRDIKPANILLDAAGRARVSDFGIAKIAGAATSLTATHTSIGSPCYMSPEHCGVSDIIPASDLFSLGIAVFEMITASLPFRADTHLALIKQITRDPLPRLRDLNPAVPGGVQEFLDRLTAKNPVDRYGTAAQVLEDLAAFAAGQPPRHLQNLRDNSHFPSNPRTSAPAPGASSEEPWKRNALVDELLSGTEVTARRHRTPAARFERSSIALTAAASVAILTLASAFWFFGLGRSAPTPFTSPPDQASIAPDPAQPLIPVQAAQPQSPPPPPPDDGQNQLPPPQWEPGMHARPPIGPDGRPLPRWVPSYPGEPPPPGYPAPPAHRRPPNPNR